MNIFAEIAKTYKIIDFHMHPYSNLSESICRYKDSIGMTPADLAADMVRCGISRWCGSVIDCAHKGPEYNNDFSLTAALNDSAMALAKADPRLIPGIHIHPKFPEESMAEVERAYAAGVRIIGELVPYSKGWHDYSDPALFDVFERAGQLGMIVSFHSNDDDDQMEGMIKAHPHTIFVAAHPGEYAKYMKHLDRLKRYENAYLDISGTGLFRYGMLAHGVKTVGSERLLFGSDYPTVSPGMYVAGVLYEKLSENDYENIFHRNAERLLGL